MTTSFFKQISLLVDGTVSLQPGDITLLQSEAFESMIMTDECTSKTKTGSLCALSPPNSIKTKMIVLALIEVQKFIKLTSYASL